jgi:hypothetical protein
LLVVEVVVIQTLVVLCLAALAVENTQEQQALFQGRVTTEVLARQVVLTAVAVEAVLGPLALKALAPEQVMAV